MLEVPRFAASDAALAWQLIDDIAKLSRDDGKMPNPKLEIGRHAYAFSRIEYRLHDFFADLVRDDMRGLGKIEGRDFSIRRDAIGNTIVTYFGRNPQLRVVQMHSHLDSVPEGGKFDGPAGIAAGRLVYRTLAKRAQPPLRSFRLIAYRSEESSPHNGSACLGSAWAARSISRDAMERIQYIAPKNGKPGKKLSDVFPPEQWERILAHLDAPANPDDDPYCVLETHIEQSPHIAAAGKQIGIVVDSIAGAVRWSFSARVEKRAVTLRGNYAQYDLVFMGEKNHTGTAPPNTHYLKRDRTLYRKDALVASSLVALALLKSGKVELLRSEQFEDTGYTTVPAEHHLSLLVERAHESAFVARLLRLRDKVWQKLGVRLHISTKILARACEDVVEDHAARRLVALPAVVSMLSTRAYRSEETALGKTRGTIADYHLTPAGFTCKFDGREVDHVAGKRFFDEVRRSMLRRVPHLVIKQVSAKQSEPVAPWMVAGLREAAERYGISYMLLPSHAGHDTDRLAGKVPAAMLFYRQEAGISHNPREDCTAEDFNVGNVVAVDYVLQLLEHP